MSTTGADPATQAGQPSDGGSGTPSPASDAGQPKKIHIPDDLMPLVNAKIAEREAGIRSTERARLLAEMKEKQDREGMTELQKRDNDLAAEKTARQEAEKRLARLERTQNVRAASEQHGFIPSEILASAIEAAGENDTADDIAKKAAARWADLVKRSGGAAPKPSGVPQGGAQAATDQSLAGMSELEIRKKARHDRKWFEEFGRKELDRRFLNRNGLGG